MNLSKLKQSASYLKNRFLRFRPIDYIKRHIIIFTLLFVFLLSNLIGLWNIRKYDVVETNGNEIPLEIHSQIDTYAKSKFKNLNFFLFSTDTIEKDLKNSITYIKDIDVEKIVPNKLNLNIEIYKPIYSALLKENKCYLLEEKGLVLQEICKDDPSNCCPKYSQDNGLKYFHSVDVTVSNINQTTQKLFIMDIVYEIVKVISSGQFNVSDISLTNNILEVTTMEKQSFVFSLSENINIQLQRFVAVSNRVKVDDIGFKSIDFRFERPVLK